MSEQHHHSSHHTHSSSSSSNTTGSSSHHHHHHHEDDADKFRRTQAHSIKVKKAIRKWGYFLTCLLAAVILFIVIYIYFLADRI